MRLRVIVCLILLVLVTSTVVTYHGKTSSQTSNNNVSNQKTIIDFGNQDPAYELEVKIPITNTGDNNLNISGFQLSCSCLTITPPQLNISPRETAIASMTVNLLKNLDLSTKYSDTIPVSFDIVAFTGTDQPLFFNVKGHVTPRIQLSQSRLNFGTLKWDDRTNCVKRVEVHAYGNTQFFGIQTSKDILDIKIIDETDSLTKVLYISPKSDLSAGKHLADIMITSSSLDGKKHITPLRIELIVPQPIQVYPEHLFLGSHPLNTSVEEQYQIMTKPGLNIINVSQTGEENHVTSKILKKVPNKWNVNSIVNIKSMGNTKLEITLSIDVQDDRTLVSSRAILRLPISYYGLSIE